MRYSLFSVFLTSHPLWHATLLHPSFLHLQFHFGESLICSLLKSNVFCFTVFSLLPYGPIVCFLSPFFGFFVSILMWLVFLPPLASSSLSWWLVFLPPRSNCKMFATRDNFRLSQSQTANECGKRGNEERNKQRERSRQIERRRAWKGGKKKTNKAGAGRGARWRENLLLYLLSVESGGRAAKRRDKRNTRIEEGEGDGDDEEEGGGGSCGTWGRRAVSSDALEAIWVELMLRCSSLERCWSEEEKEAGALDRSVLWSERNRSSEWRREAPKRRTDESSMEQLERSRWWREVMKKRAEERELRLDPKSLFDRSRNCRGSWARIGLTQ